MTPGRMMKMTGAWVSKPGASGGVKEGVVSGRGWGGYESAAGWPMGDRGEVCGHGSGQVSLATLKI